MKKIILLQLFCLLLCLNQAFAFAPFKAPTNTPLGFVKNEGQMQLNNHQSADEILYRYAGNNLQVNLRKAGFSYELTQLETSPIALDAAANAQVRGHRIDVNFIHANENVTVIESNESLLPLFAIDKNNANKRKQLHHFKRLLYKNIYPSIDIEFLLGDKGFKYNFILHPGANINAIQFNVVGADKIQLTEKGNLHIFTSCGLIEENIPLSWSEQGKNKQTFLARFVALGRNHFGITSKEKTSTLKRVIDPAPYSSYVGGPNIEFADALVSDDTGNFYFIGRTLSTTGIATPGAYQTKLAGTSSYDAFITKFDKTGTIIWATYFGGPGDEKPYEAKIDKQGNIVICGFTSSTTGIATSGAFQEVLGGGQDAFICKFNPGGGLIWSTYYGFASDDNLISLAVDVDGDYYFTGVTKSTNTYAYPNTHQTTNAGSQDAYIVKMSSAGIVYWATFYGGLLDDTGGGILVDQNKNIYLAGSAYSLAGIATSGTYQVNQGGNSDMFVVKFDSMGTRIFGTYIGGASYDNTVDFCFDKNNNLILVAQTGSLAGVATSGAYQTTYGGGSYDAVLGKLNTNGVVDFITYIGGTGVDLISGVCVDNNNKIYLVGHTNSGAGIVSLDGYDTSYGGGATDVYYSCYSNLGIREWASYFGGESGDYGAGIFVSKDNDLVIGGLTYSTTNIASTGAAKTTREGTTDNFILIYNLGAPVSGPCTNPIKAGFTINKLIQCERDNQFVYIDTTRASNTASRVWNFGNNTFGSAQTETVHYLPVVDNKFTVRLTVTDGNCIDSAKKDVFLIRSPGAKTSTGNILPRPGITETYTVPSSNGSTYKWVYESGQAVGTTFTNTIKIKWLTEDSVDLKVVETNGGGCTGDTNYLQVVIYDPTGMQELLDMGRIAVYPNPSNNSIYIEDITQSNMPFTLTDIYGKIVLAGIQNNGEAIDISQLPMGVYLLQMGNYQGFVKLAIMH